MSVAWYTWLEEGRPADPSPEVMDAIARALRLDTESHRHLRRFAGRHLQPSDNTRPRDAVTKPASD